MYGTLTALFGGVPLTSRQVKTSSQFPITKCNHKGEYCEVSCVVLRPAPAEDFLLLPIFLSGISIAALAQGSGYWHTSASQIVDSNDQKVRIAGINWYGFETTDRVVHGLWSQDYHTILKAIKNNGYNVIRLPYSNQMVESPVVPSSISFSNGSGPINTDLKGLNSLEVMDKVISAAGSPGLRVIRQSPLGGGQ